MSLFEDIMVDLQYYKKQLKPGERILISVTEICCDEGCKLCRDSGWLVEAKTLMSDEDE